MSAQRGPGRPGGHGHGGKKEKAKNFWGTTARLLRYMSTKAYAIGLVFVLGYRGDGISNSDAENFRSSYDRDFRRFEKRVHADESWAANRQVSD